MTISYSVLKNEITTDPLHIGYSGYVSSGNHLGLANILNNVNGPGATGITTSSLTRDNFLLAIIPAISAIASGTPTIKDKWDRILGVIRSADIINNNATVQYLLSQSVTDGLWTQPQANAVFVRNGSRAEVLFGENTIVTHIDVGTALLGS